ncbi:hypothetical protein [Rhizobium nepotum]|uniref:Uncharacterized protein n=1 Tax=Rhizobium nepotum 39/7 TaxID=1368418 RepID=A0ABR5CSS9_9HYPH|nr:hypothetical protein [Rhizobium nepotum]KJF67902.1 hypothetical protein RS75_10595 [Rhizobium nepotum 39/7]
MIVKVLSTEGTQREMGEHQPERLHDIDMPKATMDDDLHEEIIIGTGPIGSCNNQKRGMP